jgi:diketogulonate reductase-like aldo/keto reductase
MRTLSIKVSYRSRDTTQAYSNEKAMGKAVSKYGLPRGELFITTNSNFAKERKINGFLSKMKQS